MVAAASVFNKLTLRLKDRPIAARANTSVLPKAGKPYALRFHHSSSSTAACSMWCSTVQRSARHCRAYAQRPRPDSRPAYLHAMYADMYQYQCPHLTTLASHRTANIRCRQGRAYTDGYRLRLSLCSLGPTSCTSDRPACARGCGRRQAWYRLAREAVCWWA